MSVDRVSATLIDAGETVASMMVRDVKLGRVRHQSVTTVALEHILQHHGQLGISQRDFLVAQRHRLDATIQLGQGRVDRVALLLPIVVSAPRSIPARMLQKAGDITSPFRPGQVTECHLARRFQQPLCTWSGGRH